MVIYKYLVKSNAFELELPGDARFLSVQVQNGVPQMWFLHTTHTNYRSIRKFIIFGTGEEIHEKPDTILDYLGTFQLAGGTLIWHLFEEF